MLCNNTNCGMSYLSTSPFSSGIGEQSPITPSAITMSWHHHHSILAFMFLPLQSIHHNLVLQQYCYFMNGGRSRQVFLVKGRNNFGDMQNKNNESLL